MDKFIAPRANIIISMIIWGTLGILILLSAYMSERSNDETDVFEWEIL